MPKPKPRVALYCRTSRAGQHIDVQLGQLRQVAEQRSWEVIGEFVDDEVSSRNKSRPAFENMLKAANAGGFDLVAAVALDRYARSVRELLDLGERLNAYGVNMISLRESIDTTTAVGRMTFTVLAAVAEFERELIRERTLAGLDQARRRGKQLGRPTIDVDTDRARHLRDQRLSWREVGRKLGASPRTIRRALARREGVAKTSPAEASATN